MREGYLRTTYAFTQLHYAMRELIDPRRHAFSFQMQSLYDASVPGVPHFIYTDHTHLSNLHYPDFDRSALGFSRLAGIGAHSLRERGGGFHPQHRRRGRSDTFYERIAAKIECVYAGSNVDVTHYGPPDNHGYSNQRIFFVGIDWYRKGGPELFGFR